MTIFNNSYVQNNTMWNNVNISNRFGGDPIDTLFFGGGGGVFTGSIIIIWQNTFITFGHSANLLELQKTFVLLPGEQWGRDTD